MPARSAALGADCVRARRGAAHAGCLARLVAGQAVSPSLSACVSRLSALFQRFFTALSVLRTRRSSSAAEQARKGGAWQRR